MRFVVPDPANAVARYKFVDVYSSGALECHSLQLILFKNDIAAVAFLKPLDLVVIPHGLVRNRIYVPADHPVAGLRIQGVKTHLRCRWSQASASTAQVTSESLR